ncbi:class I SAM-dependent methyltransferase [Neomegalonema perideroedes]|uniref:class I SAM-dependent methyltransferase n=1 Tax=Neomegalonema perideroedes TaxID=217219 RepID=UPI00037A161E|nr:class I SAM-dependent methyltransferase [Neomegalonema perideroedes]
MSAKADEGRVEWFAANRRNWDDRADIHIRDETGFYGVEAAVRGDVLLTPIELAEIGDLRGLRAAHLQCHIGADVLALAHLGAAEAVGLDFSPRAILHARELARRSGLSGASFVEGSVYDAPALLGGGFDLALVNWGAIPWLDDLDLWAQAVAGVLKPGGRLYFIDGHPTLMLFDGASSPQEPRVGFDYGTPRETPISSAEETSYDGSSAKIANPLCYEWLHPVSRVLGAVLKAGFRLDFLHEHEALAWRFFPQMIRGEDGLYRLPEGTKRLPLAWSFGATLIR